MLSEDDFSCYTRIQAMKLLGIKSRSTFHYLRRHYPKAFVVIRQGTGRARPTLYKKTALDKFIEWRNLHFHFKPD